MEDNRNIWIDYLRSFLTVLVVAHHSSLAYTTFANFDKNVYIDSTNPVVDVKRWIGLDIFQNFNDIFFMSLMFLIGGLFLSKSISKKGTKNFLMDRVCRLLIPFLFLGTLFMLIAYFPAYWLSYNNTNVTAYVHDFFTTQRWPAGPTWFIWVLFLFNFLLVFINPIIKRLKLNIKNLLTNLETKPSLLFVVSLLMTWLLYVPIAHTVGAGIWTGWLPFDFQLSRILLYFGYFMIGVLIGNTDFNSNLLSQNSPVIKSWWIWITLSLSIYVLLTISTRCLTDMVTKGKINEFKAWMIYFTIFVSSCVSSCLAFITAFRKWAVHKIDWCDSLSENAYLIYLTHYIFVVWMQFLLLKYELPAFFKFSLTFSVTLACSWTLSYFLRKLRFFNRYL